MSSTEQFFSMLLSYQYIAVAAQMLLVHDYFLTFPLEVDHIWNSRWSTVKVIFLLSRYGSLVGQSAYTLEVLGILSHGSSKFCRRYEGFIVFYGLFQSEAVRVLVLLRAWVIWGCKRYVAVVLIFAYAVYASVFSGMLIYILVLRGARDLPFMHLAETGVCISQSASGTADNFSWIVPSISLVLDCIVFFVVALSLGKFFKETQCLGHPQYLLRALAADAALYLAASAVTSVIGILSQTIFSNDLLIYLMLACNPLVIITGQRVVLNLRSMQSLPYSQQDFDLNLVTDPSLLPLPAKGSRRAPDGYPLCHGHEAAGGIQMLHMPANRL